MLTFIVLAIQTLINGIIECIRAPCSKLFFRQGKIIFAISKHNLSVLAISGKGHVYISITFLHGNCHPVIRLQSAAIKLADKLLISRFLLLSQRTLDVFIKRNRSAHLFNLSIRNLLNRRLSLLIRHNNKASTIFVSLLQEHLLAACKSSWHDITVFRLVWPKLFLQSFPIAIISMLQSINSAILGIHSLHILADSLFLGRSKITGTLSHKLLHVSAFIIRLGHQIKHSIAISKRSLQAPGSQIAIIVNSLQSIGIPILISLLTHNKSIGVCNVCSRVCITRTWYGVGTVLVRSRSC